MKKGEGFPPHPFIPQEGHCEERQRLRGAAESKPGDSSRRSEQAPQSGEIALLRPEHHAVQGFARNDNFITSSSREEV